MGIVINQGVDRFKEAVDSKIYVDKTLLLKYCNSVIKTQQKYICISRPRRFGKTIAASMLAAYYDRSVDSRQLFDGLNISKADSYLSHINKYNVISINIQDYLDIAGSIDKVILSIKSDIFTDLQDEQDMGSMESEQSLSRILMDYYRICKVPFVFVFDEWDSVFRNKGYSIEDQERFLDFLRELLKDRTYVALAYMTGILPIKKYGTHSALNMFDEFSMEEPGELAEFVGFTENEVKSLCKDYKISFQKCKEWYDGYSFTKCKSVYNPKSIVSVMLSGLFSDYWNQTETYEALRIYIDMNYDELRDSILAMMSLSHIEINTGSFTNDLNTFSNADDVMTLLIHLGYLAYDFGKKEVYIPNKEIMQEFATTTMAGGWSEVINSVKNSADLLAATLNKDAEAVAKYIQSAHFESSHLQYNDENALSYVVSLAYYSARQYYTIVREMPAGNGFADMAFIPRKNDKPALIVELKWNKSADSAIRQINEKRYSGVLSNHSGTVLLVAVNYDKRTREHQCIIQEAGKPADS